MSAPRPILFSAPMVRALLAGRKTQTRRVLKPQPYDFPDPNDGHRCWNASGMVGGRICISDTDLLAVHRKPMPGDRLWVREAWRTESDGYNDLAPSDMSGEETILYEADTDWSANKSTGRKRASMHMPRWASRLTLIVTDVRVQRLQEIGGVDSIAEGAECATCAAMAKSACRDLGCFASLKAFRGIWEAINGPGSWAANPWVAAYTFTVHKQNVDQMGG